MPASKVQKPDFIVVGAMKSGTTSLTFQLRNHKRICFPNREIHFFDDESNFGKGTQWYLDQLSKDRREETALTGEKTAAYCYLPNVAERIRGAFPEVKLVWLFRNPVDRAYSNYLHAYCNGAERLSFDEAVRMEPQRVGQRIFQGYLERSRYHKQVARFLEHFERSRMHFMIFEEFVEKPREEMERLFRFLGVSLEGFDYVDSPRGKTVIPRLQSSVWLARKVFGTGAMWRAVRQINLWGKKPGYPKLTERQRSQLAESFREDNGKLSALIGKELGIWDNVRGAR